MQNVRGSNAKCKMKNAKVKIEDEESGWRRWGMDEEGPTLCDE